MVGADTQREQAAAPLDLQLSQKVLGRGGFATVLRATWRGKAVAVKLLSPKYANAAGEAGMGTSSPQRLGALYTQQFIKEASLLRALEHA
jgi:serine/threonine protein kinase